MAKLTKNRKDSLSKFDKDKLYSLEEASNIIKDFSPLKFDSSVDIAVNLGVLEEGEHWNQDAYEDKNCDH